MVRRNEIDKELCLLSDPSKTYMYIEKGLIFLKSKQPCLILSIHTERVERTVYGNLGSIKLRVRRFLVIIYT